MELWTATQDLKTYSHRGRSVARLPVVRELVMGRHALRCLAQDDDVRVLRFWRCREDR